MPEDIIITVPDGSTARIRDSIARKYRYATIGRPGETKVAFAKRMTKDWWRSIVLEDEAAASVSQAKAAVYNNPNDPLVADTT